MISWELKYYQELSTELLYLILKTRQEVFVIEQQCNYLDADNLDQKSRHLMGFQDDKLVAYMRIVDKNTIYKHVSLGRILIVKEYRGKGLGCELMNKAIDLIDIQKEPVVMSAQSYLINFYQNFGFKIVGDEYLEDGIPHIKMIRYG